MRYAIFSDIHSNLEAFSAVLDALKQECIERYFCIGDIVGYATNPSECILMVKDLAPVIVAGNHDYGACGKLDLEYFVPRAKEALQWTQGILVKEEFDFLCRLPLVHSEENFVLAHGTLDAPQEFYYLNHFEEADRSFAVLEKQVCFVGHTHRPGVFVERDGEIFHKALGVLELEAHKRYIVNVGSVGQPRDGDPRACFVVYDADAKTIEVKRVEYNFSLTQKKILKSGLPESLALRLAQGK
ncbi:MAG: hypothetical protein A2Y00_00485 [Omnitrophica WOR_2 bacterium GWF2_43_52]|nr:MAG: hypothetical protein A2062_01965 [Omnitrophica WOR_2 bacterium GWA2_44_7]OGX14425.1 MAG: hypothetical protein A2Y01_07660 [Omnitrophica WOR_2 bacterium GWC2_44_8]OGX20941.1 MAG: hypothetical protein A2Y00_00485 [Omnitrophica WOR_2 bacterium GWF2_43_52]OGX57134.1 MAG: hypothetical protein A2460_01125 [Omnitrophica WOR_2 bacterium RIFOXYC2_FULL_43_9]HAH21119.1 hypothetical protein [Candidatus Omnitrophota bacterium]